MIPLGILGNRRGGAAAPAYELISTTLLATNQTSITLSSIPSTYKHLQVRFTAQIFESSANYVLRMYVNDDSAANWSRHYIFGDGSSVASGAVADTNFDMRQIIMPDNYGGNANIYGAGIIDILDYANTSKNKTVRALGGNPYSGSYKGVVLHSGSWRNTAAISSITFRTPDGASYPLRSGSRFSLYGIKG